MIPLLTIIHLFFQVYSLLIFARVILSWLPEYGTHPLARLLYQCTDPYLNVFRQFIPPLANIDFSPIIAFYCLYFIENLLIKFVMVFF